MSPLARLLLATALSVAAIFVPLQAGALQGGGGGLNVGATLQGCGSGAEGVSCQIDVSWSGVAGADHYTADVTLADGSVRGMGRVGAGEIGGGASLWVPYAGDGFYMVTVTAWAINDEGEKEKVDEDSGKADPAKDSSKAEGKEKAEPGEAEGDSSPDGRDKGRDQTDDPDAGQSPAEIPDPAPGETPTGDGGDTASEEPLPGTEAPAGSDQPASGPDEAEAASDAYPQSADSAPTIAPAGDTQPAE